MICAPFCTQVGNTAIYWHPVNYYYRGVWLGTGRERAFRTNGGVWALVSNRLLYCPTCGEVWGKTTSTVNPNIADYDREVLWRADAAPCEKHGKVNFLSDVAFDTIDENLLENYPWKILVISAVGAHLPSTN